jgi:hypothetical protein
LADLAPVQAAAAELVADDKAAASKPAAAGKPPANRTAPSVGEDEIPF